jgi:hypothetical protein
MLLCAVAHLPMDWSRVAIFGLAAAIAVSAVCAIAGVVLCLSRSLTAAVVSTLVAGALAVGYLAADRLGSGPLSQVLWPEGVPAPLPALSAMVAALAALLTVALMVAGPRTPAAGRETSEQV